jgi:hypothetical protein
MTTDCCSFAVPWECPSGPDDPLPHDFVHACDIVKALKDVATSHLSPEGVIRQAVQAGDAARRSQHAVRRLVALLPYAAGGVLAVAVVLRMFNSTKYAGVAALAAGAAALATAVVMAFRRRVPADVVAAELDEAAGLRGALRSAAWFVEQPPAADAVPREWVGCHVERAAAAVSDIPWPAVFKRPDVGRAAALSGVLALGAVLVPFWPHRAPRPAAQIALATGGGAGTAANGLLSLGSDPELRDAFRNMKQGKIPSKRGLSAVQKALQQAEMDPELAAELEQYYSMGDEERAIMESEWQDQKDRYNEALQRKIAEELKTGKGQLEWAFEDTMARAAAQGTQTQQQASADPSKGNANSAQQAQSNTNSNQSNSQQSSNSDSQANARQGAANGPAEGSPLMAGGGETAFAHPDDPVAQAAAKAAAARVTGALRKEVINASGDAVGANIKELSTRRTTNSGQTDVVPVKDTGDTNRYDRSRADRPPAVPEPRQALVRQYFTRPPTSDTPAATK